MPKCLHLIVLSENGCSQFNWYSPQKKPLVNSYTSKPIEITYRKVNAGDIDVASCGEMTTGARCPVLETEPRLSVGVITEHDATDGADDDIRFVLVTVLRERVEIGTPTGLVIELFVDATAPSALLVTCT